MSRYAESRDQKGAKPTTHRVFLKCLGLEFGCHRLLNTATLLIGVQPSTLFSLLGHDEDDFRLTNGRFILTRLPLVIDRKSCIRQTFL